MRKALVFLFGLVMGTGLLFTAAWAGHNCAPGAVVIHYGSGNDVDGKPYGSTVEHCMDGQGNNDTLGGGGGVDKVLGGVGDDTLEGGPGVDVVWGEDGSDTVYGGCEPFQEYPGQCTDIDAGDDVRGGDARDYVYGGPGYDHLYDGRGDDFLIHGGAGEDTWWHCHDGLQDLSAASSVEQHEHLNTSDPGC